MTSALFTCKRVNVLFPALTRASISSTFVAWILKFQDHAKGNLDYYLFNDNVDMRKGIFRVCEYIREELKKDPSDTKSVYMFMAKNRKVVKLPHPLQPPYTRRLKWAWAENRTFTR